MEQSRTCVLLPGWEAELELYLSPENQRKHPWWESSSAARPSDLPSLRWRAQNQIKRQTRRPYKDCLENTNLTWTSLSNMQWDFKESSTIFPAANPTDEMYSAQRWWNKKEKVCRKLSAESLRKYRKTELSDSENLHRAGVCCYGKHHLWRR